jgi:hypothetical protein
MSRVTDDCERMAECGCVALSEPAFWAGFDRGFVEGGGLIAGGVRQLTRSAWPLS